MEYRCFHLDYENELVHFKHGAPDADPEVQGSTRIPPSALAWEQGVTTSQPGQPFSGRTIWIRNLQTPLREFLRTETGGASVLLFAAIAALVWSTSTRPPTTRSGRRRSRSTLATLVSRSIFATG